MSIYGGLGFRLGHARFHGRPPGEHLYCGTDEMIAGGLCTRCLDAHERDHPDE